MALGTISAVPRANYVSGNKRVRVYDVQLTSGANYTTGGETITAAAVGLRHQIDQVNVLSSARVTTGGASSVQVAVQYVSQASVKLQAYFGAATAIADAEVAANTDLSTYSVRIAFTGA